MLVSSAAMGMSAATIHLPVHTGDGATRQVSIVHEREPHRVRTRSPTNRTRYATRTRPAWRSECLTELSAAGGLRPFEPFAKRDRTPGDPRHTGTRFARFDDEVRA